MKKIIGGIIIIVILFIVVYFGYPYYRIYTIKDKPTFCAQKSKDITIVFEKEKTIKFKDLGVYLKNNNVIDNAKDFEILSTFKNFDDYDIPFKKIKILEQWKTYNILVNNLYFAVVNHKKIVDVVINNMRTVADVSGKVSKFIDLDSSTLKKYLDNDTLIQFYGFNRSTWPAFFLPNTYECYTKITPSEFIQKLAKGYNYFWNLGRRNKAKKIGLSQSEVTTLASIVYEEQRVNYDEHSKIAGLYINRLNRGILLQADPTVKFALNDHNLRRVLLKHLEIESPYNTYKYKGLPPGPICMPDTRVIDAVLNYKHHDYIFMCAKPEYSGFHNFSKTNAEHEKYRAKYIAWLKSERIK